MLGSGVAKPVAVCDTAVLHSPHSNAVDKMAIAEGAKRLDEGLMNRVLPLGLSTSLPLDFVELLLLLPGQLPPGEQAAAIPPGLTLSRAQKHSCLPALLVGFVVASVSARRREIEFSPRRGASIPG